MPYIKQQARPAIDRAVNALASELDIGRLDKGEFNYLLTKLVMLRVRTADKFGYATLSDTAGVLADVRHEFVRRIMDPYEDQKRAENGDVYA